MARPRENGVAYFPLDVDNDDKLDLIEAEFGLTGFAVIVKLYQRIYKLGYYCEWNDEVALLFAKRLGLGDSVVSEIVSAAIRRALFDEEIYRKYGVLTSRGIQKRYFEIVARRKNVEVEKRYLLIHATHRTHDVNMMYAETPVNADMMYAETPVNADMMYAEVHKVKESKVKESKVKKTTTTPYPSGDGAEAVVVDSEWNPFADTGDYRPSFDTPEAYASKMLRGFNSDKARQELISYLEDLPGDVVRYAIDYSFESGNGTWFYCKRVLEGYLERRLKTLDAVKEDDARHRQAMKRKQDGKPERPKAEVKWV